MFLIPYGIFNFISYEKSYKNFAPKLPNMEKSCQVPDPHYSYFVNWR